MDSALAQETGQWGELLRLEEFFSNPSKPGFALLSGPSGVGKTWLGECLHQRRLDRGAKSILFTPREDRQFEPYVTLTERISSIEHHGLSSLVRRVSSDFSSPIPTPTGAATYFATRFLNRSQIRRRERLRYLNEKEQRLLFDLDEYAGKEDLLLVADDIQFWDKASARFIEYLASGDAQDLFPVVGRLKILFVFTIGEIDERDPLWKLCHSVAGLNISLSVPNESVTKAALKYFGSASSVSEDTIRVLHRCSSGHLGVVRLVASYLDVSTQVAEQQDKHVDISVFVDRIIETLKEQLGENGRANLDLIERLSIAGKAFSREEAACLMSSQVHALKSALSDLLFQRFFKIDKSELRFLHPIVWRHFRDKALDDPGICSTFARCLQRLRPDDYLFRYQMHYAAGEYEDAAVCRVQAAIKSIQNGQTIPLLDHAETSLIEDYRLTSAYDALTFSYDHFRRGEVQEALTKVNEIGIPSERRISAERAIIQARCAFLLPNAVQRQQSIDELEGYDDLKESEPDLWQRLGATLENGLIIDRQRSRARRVSTLLQQHAQKFGGIKRLRDEFINAMHLRSDALFENKVSRRLLIEAAQFYGPSHEDGPPRNVVRYYIALTNLTANALTAGAFADAMNYAIAIDQLLESAGEQIDLPRPETAFNNFVLAEYFSGRCQPAAALGRLQGYLDQGRPRADTYLMPLNLQAFMIRCGSWQSAIPAAEEALAKLEPWEEHDAYDACFMATNYASALHLAGRCGEARSILERCRHLNELLGPHLHQMLTRRHTAMQQAFDEVSPGDLEEWVRYFDPTVERGGDEAWRFYGHCVLFTDIQIWSDY